MKTATFLFLVGSLSLIGVSGCRGDQSRCEDLCETLDDCDGVSVDVEDCVDECVDDADKASDRCLEAFEALADCGSEENLDCDEFVDDGECESEADDFEDDCDDDFEDTFDEVEETGA